MDVPFWPGPPARTTVKSVCNNITYLRSLLYFSNLRLPAIDTIEPYEGKLGSPALITVIGGDTEGRPVASELVPSQGLAHVATVPIYASGACDRNHRRFRNVRRVRTRSQSHASRLARAAMVRGSPKRAPITPKVRRRCSKRSSSQAIA